MASIRMVPEGEAVGDVRVIYDAIKPQFGIDFVPNLYRPSDGHQSGLSRGELE